MSTKFYRFHILSQRSIPVMGVNVPIFQVGISPKILDIALYFFHIWHCSQLQKRYERMNIPQNVKFTELCKPGHRLIWNLEWSLAWCSTTFVPWETAYLRLCFILWWVFDIPFYCIFPHPGILWERSCHQRICRNYFFWPRPLTVMCAVIGWFSYIHTPSESVNKHVNLILYFLEFILK